MMMANLPSMGQPEPPLVLHVIHHLYVGGMENGLVNLINNMPPNHYRHAIACIEDYSDFCKRITRPGVDIFALHRSQIGVWKLRYELFRLCRKLQPTIVHSRNLSGLDALLPARLAGVPHCIHGEHGWDISDLAGLAWKPNLLRRLHSPLIQHYITVSKDLQRHLIERVGISAKRISQVYNGVDTERFAPLAEKPKAWLPPAFRGDDLILIGSVGRMQSVKDHATLIQAFSQLIENQPDLRKRLRLLIVGDGPMLDELRTLANSLNLSKLAWLPGSRENIPEVYQALDVFVLPSLNEGISNTILEAMASRLPVVATAVGGNVELVEDGVCGRLFPARDINVLAQILEAYAMDESLRLTHSQAARTIAVERYSLQAMVSRYQRIYDLMRQSNPTPFH